MRVEGFDGRPRPSDARASRQPDAVTFDYGNNIRAMPRRPASTNAFDFPGFVPAFIRPLFCEGKGPFRVGRAVGRTGRYRRHRSARWPSFSPTMPASQRWLKLAAEKVPVQGLPARICWLGYGERARAGLRIQRDGRLG